MITLCVTIVLKQGDYVLINLQGLKNTANCVPRISNNSSSDDLETGVTYLATKSTKRIFDDEESVRCVFPDNSRSYPVPMEDIMKKLLVRANNGWH